MFDFLGKKLKEYKQHATIKLGALNKKISKLKKENKKLEQMVENLKKEVEKKGQRAKEIENLQERFMIDASHELRTPLTILQTNLDLLDSLAANRKPGDIRSIIAGSKNQIKFLTTIIEELTLLSRGKRPEEFREELELGTFIGDIVKELKPLAKAKDIGYKIRILDKDLIIRGDEMMLGKLIRNLVSNAVKYGRERGKIEITLGRQKEKAELKVTDNGIGIPKEDLPHIFERFYRIDKGRSKEKGGTGLGLAICKWIVELHGGKIEAESTYGKGSIFKVFLPLKGTWEDKESFWAHKSRERERERERRGF